MPSKTDIWMPLYIGDILADTSHLDAERFGCYMLWLMHYWRKGPLSGNLPDLVGIGKLRCADAPSIAQALLTEFFTQNGDGKWHQKRCDAEREKWTAKRDAKIESGKAGALNKWGNSEDLAKSNRSERLANARRLARHSAAEWQAILWVCGNVCVKCGAVEDIVKDHILPIYRGGSDGIENIQPFCRSCNAAKGPENIDYRPNDWSQRLAERLAEPVVNAYTSPSSSPSPSPIPLTLTAPPEKPKKQKTSIKQKPEKPVDPRREDFIEDLQLHWKGFAKTKFVFDKIDGAQVDLFLKTWPDITREKWRDCLRNRKLTPGVIPTERIYRWLPKLGNFLNGSLNEYGKLINGGNSNATVFDGKGGHNLGLSRNFDRQEEYSERSLEDGYIQGN